MDKLVFSYDIGIGQTGWAVINADTRKVLESGVNNFPSGDASENITRRSFRQLRRLHRRQKTRISDFEVLWERSGFSFPKVDNTNVLSLRNKGLSEELTADEIFCVLRYMLKHRGISYLEDDIDENATSDYAKGIAYNQKELSSKLPCQIQADRFEKLGTYRGDNLTEIDEEPVTLRNVFTTSAYLQEVLIFLKKQSSFNKKIDEEFIERYKAIFTRKREYYVGPGNELSRTNYGIYTTFINEDGTFRTDDNLFDKLIGKCSVYPEERRGAAASYTAQLFNALNDLNNLQVNGRKLEKVEKEKIIETYKSADSVNVQRIIKSVIGESIESISGYRIDKDGKELYHTMEIYRKMKKFLKEKDMDIENLSAEELDEIAQILTLNTERDGITQSFNKSCLNLDEEWILALIEFRRKNTKLFSKWHSFSLKIMTELIPELYLQPKNQMELLTEMGVFKSRTERFAECEEIPVWNAVEEIYNPVVRRSVATAYQITNALISKYGYPDKVVIEMPREANSDEEKKKIKDLQNRNEKELKEILRRIREEYDIEITEDDFRHHKGLVLKLKLWNEQGGKCLYSGKAIPIDQLIKNQNLFEVDHIIPISISLCDSRSNKVLVYATENQAKGNRTPLGYLSTVNREWNQDAYITYVKSLGFGKSKGDYSGTEKLKNLLFSDDITKVDVVKGFINRNLNDTRYASREVLNTLQDYFKSKGANTIVSVIRGSYTHQMRINLDIKKDRDEDYCHHAVDAMLIAFSQLGYDAFLAQQKQIIDFETGEILSQKKWDNQDELFRRVSYQEKWYETKKTILEAEKNVKFSHKVNRKCNRGLCNQTIYGTREYNGKIYVIDKLNLYNNTDVDSFRKLISSGKEKDLLMYENDPKTFSDLMLIFREYESERNPFVAYNKATGDFVRKYAKNHKGPKVETIKYRKELLGSCIDISHKYGFDKGSKEVVLLQLKPYRMDVYKNKETGLYRFVGLKQSDIKCQGKKYVIDETAYANILLAEKMISVGQTRHDLESLGWEFCFTFYRNNIIEYEKKGIVYKERFWSRTMPSDTNYIETKPIDAPTFSKKNQNLVGLSKTTCIRKIVTDILGNETYIDKERFAYVVDTME